MEKISENFQTAHATTNMALAAYIQYCEVMSGNPSELAIHGVRVESAKRIAAFVEAKEKLQKVKGLLQLMRLTQPLAALDKYFAVIEDANVTINFEDTSSKRVESVSNLNGTLEIEQDHVQTALSAAFDEI